jgi:transposase
VTRVEIMGLRMARNFFEVQGADAHGTRVLDRVIPRGALLKFFSTQKQCLVKMQAGVGADHWARKLTDIGHTVRIVPSEKSPKAASGKTAGRKSAEPLLCMVDDPGEALILPKSLQDQSIELQVRAEKVLNRQRLQLINTIRTSMAEFGYLVPSGYAWISELNEIVEGEGRTELPQHARGVLQNLFDMLDQFEHAIRQLERLRTRFISDVIVE